MSNLARNGSSDVTTFDRNGDGSPDVGFFRTVTTKCATIIHPDDDDATSKSVAVLLSAARHHPFKSFRYLAGWACFWLLIAGFGIAVVRRNNPEPPSDGLNAIAPQNLGTRFGYFVKTPLQDSAEYVGGKYITNEGNTAQAANIGTRRRSNVE